MSSDIGELVLLDVEEETTPQSNGDFKEPIEDPLASENLLPSVAYPQLPSWECSPVHDLGEQKTVIKLEFASSVSAEEEGDSSECVHSKTVTNEDDDDELDPECIEGSDVGSTSSYNDGPQDSVPGQVDDEKSDSTRKHHACLICNKILQRIDKHLLSCHRREPEVSRTMDHYVLQREVDGEVVAVRSREILNKDPLTGFYHVMHNGTDHPMHKIHGKAFVSDCLEIQKNWNQRKKRRWHQSTASSSIRVYDPAAFEGESSSTTKDFDPTANLLQPDSKNAAGDLPFTSDGGDKPSNEDTSSKFTAPSRFSSDFGSIHVPQTDAGGVLDDNSTMDDETSNWRWQAPMPTALPDIDFASIHVPQTDARGNDNSLVKDESSTLRSATITPTPLPDIGDSCGPEGSTEQKRGTKRTRYDTFCPFCRLWQPEYSKHLTRKHFDDPQVKALEGLSRNDRNAVYQKLRYKGLEIYNSTKGPKQPLRFVKPSLQGERIPCGHCKALLAKSSFAKHRAKCPLWPKDDEREVQKKIEGERRRIQLGRMELMTISQAVSTRQTVGHIRTNPSEALVKFISATRNDEYRQTILQDDLLVDYGNVLCTSIATEVGERGELLRRKLSLMADILLRMKKIRPEMYGSADIVNPQYWDTFIQAAREKGGWCEEDKTFRAPSLIKHLGIDVGGFAEHASPYAIIRNVPEVEKNAKKNLILKKARFHKQIGKSADINAKKKKWQERKILPLTEDIQIFHKFLTEGIATSISILEQSYNGKAWVQINNLIIVFILFLNRKRIGDVIKATVKEYEGRNRIHEGTNVYDSLNPYEKTQAHKVERVEVQAKHARALLLEPIHIQAIALILTYRQQAGVGINNKFLFGRGPTGYWNGPHIIVVQKIRSP